MCTDLAPGAGHRQSGISLIEVIVFIVVVSVGVTGLMSVLNSSLKYTADPMLRKQALAVAEALLEEVQSMPFTDCDPDFYDPLTGACTLVEAMGVEAGEARPSLATPFDNVNDYNSFTLAVGDADIGGTVFVPTGYSANVTVTSEALSTVPAADTLRIRVDVTYNASEHIVLEGYRTRYAPNDMP
jgi:MSHA pilin protein MshD